MNINDILISIQNYGPTLAKGLATLFIGLWAINKVTDWVNASMLRRKLDESLRPFFATSLKIGLRVLLLITVASLFNIETTSFIAVFGALAFAIGSALSGSLGHFASGVMILLFRPYKVGDLVKIQDNEGTIDEIQVFNTVLRTVTNKRIIIPNGIITQGTITNISGQGELRVDLNIYTVTNTDIDTVKKTIQQVAETCPLIVKPKQIDVLVHEVIKGQIHFIVRVWCLSEYYWDVYYYMQEQIKKSFDQNEIQVPQFHEN
jgi:small conductance mechanosensitive channel